MVDDATAAPSVAPAPAANRFGWLAPLAHVAGALLVALAFVSTLMTACAQQEVVHDLGALSPPITYSAAYTRWHELAQLDNLAARAVAQEGAFAKNASAADQRFEEARANFDVAWQPIAMMIPAIAATKRCGVRPGADNDPLVDSRDRTFQILRLCQKEGLLTADQGRVLAAATPDLLKAYSAAFNAELARMTASATLTAAQKPIRDRAALSAQDRAIEASFDATTKLGSSWWLGGRWLIDFPPSLVEIILAFVSGTFGALLLILVLIVYPKSDFSMTSASGYGARTLLGGLIALCVYVVLSSGTAVLGNAGASGPASSNFMAFSAIGILSGMFSDRVAGWLSNRAGAFFDTAGDTLPAVDPAGVAAEKRAS